MHLHFVLRILLAPFYLLGSRLKVVSFSSKDELEKWLSSGYHPISYPPPGTFKNGRVGWFTAAWWAFKYNYINDVVYSIDASGNIESKGTKKSIDNFNLVQADFLKKDANPEDVSREFHDVSSMREFLQKTDRGSKIRAFDDLKKELMLVLGPLVNDDKFQVNVTYRRGFLSAF